MVDLGEETGHGSLDHFFQPESPLFLVMGDGSRPPRPFVTSVGLEGTRAGWGWLGDLSNLGVQY